ncbi:MAG: hypothetical protein DBY36_05910 [Clostridiales bacterium]|nr:MAG: hypothetical protein DBY36_05910 [Clostridiales bacterium]
MYSDTRYLQYSDDEKGKRLVDDFYFILINWNMKKYIPSLQRNAQLEGIAQDEEIRFHFASEVEKDDEEYFGDSGVMFYYDYPAEEEDTAIFLTNEEFFGVLQEKSEEYLQKHAEDRQEVAELLKEIRKKLNV